MPAPRFGWLLAIVLLFGAVVGVWDSLWQPLDFDGSYNLQTAQNVATGQGFAGNDLNSYTDVKPFDPVLTTGPSTMLPIAASFALFGEGVWQFRWVMLAFYLAAAALIGLIVFKETRSRWSILAPLGFLLLGHITYKGFEYLDIRLDPIGEIPAAVFSLGAFYFWRQRKPWGMGISIALAVLSKLICVFWLPAIVVAIVIEVIAKKVDWHFWIKVIAGIAVPIVVWEGYKFFSLGGWQAYMHNWQELIYFFKIAGSGLGEHSVPASFVDKTKALWHIMQIPTSIKLLLILLVVFGVLYLARQYKAFLKTYYVPLLFAGFYLAWWFLLSDRDYVRHILPAIIICWTLVCILLIAHFKKVLVGLLVVLIMAHFAQILHTTYPVTLADQQKVAAVVAQQESGILVHDAWWQNPELQFLAHRRSVDYGKISDESNQVLVISPIMQHLAPDAYGQNLARCKTTLVEIKGYVVCRK